MSVAVLEDGKILSNTMLPAVDLEKISSEIAKVDSIKVCLCSIYSQTVCF